MKTTFYYISDKNNEIINVIYVIHMQIIKFLGNKTAFEFMKPKLNL